MITGTKTFVDPYSNPAILRQDYLRSGTLGGAGEGVWGADCEMLVDGTIPVEFLYGPPAGEDWVLESVEFSFLHATGGTPLEFGTIGNPLVRDFHLMLWNTTLIAANALAGIICNGDFLKLGEPYIATTAAAGDLIRATWKPQFPIMLHGNDGELLWVSINSDLTVVGAGISLSAQARAYKVVG